MLEKYLNRIEFNSYEDFKADFKIKIPENFNFAYDVVDETALKTPDKMQWYGVMIKGMKLCLHSGR